MTRLKAIVSQTGETMIPAVNGSNISVNYSSDGTSVLKRDANGNFSNVSTGVAASTHTIKFKSNDW